MAFKPKLTPDQVAANLAAGLTPTGKIPKGPSPGVKKGSVPNRKNGMDKVPKYQPGDYRHLGLHFTPERKNRYLAALAKHGARAAARIEVGITERTEVRHRAEDPLFRQGMDEAMRQYGAKLIQEIHRRGVEGVPKPVFGSMGPNAGTGVVGFVTEYSDRLLLAQAQRFEPEYTPKQKVEHSGQVKLDGLDLDKLCPESQDDLRRILERELERRKSDGTPTDPPVS